MMDNPWEGLKPEIYILSLWSISLYPMLLSSKVSMDDMTVFLQIYSSIHQGSLRANMIPTETLEKYGRELRRLQGEVFDNMQAYFTKRKTK